jgi:adenylate kinase
MDGYPRTLAQAEALSLIACTGEKAIFIEVTETEAVERLLSRMTCSNCGAIYNLISKPPKNAGTCDLCHGRVEKRTDDNEHAVRQRFRVYTERTMPVIEYYGRKNILVRVDGGGMAARVYKKIKELIA